jgi:hypothetical protein
MSAAAPSIPASPGPAAASSPLAYTAASIAAASNQIYLFERAAGVLYPADGWVDSPCIVVGGSYKTGAKSWYRLDFASTGSTPSPLALIRNHSYNFTITGVTGSGYGSAESARTSLPANMTGEVVSWDENDLSAPITGRLYNITVNSTAGGTALAKYSKAPAGTQITVLASPSSGKVFDGWASISSDGDAISPAPATAASNNPLSFTMPAGNVTVVPKWADANNTNFLLVTPDAKTFAAGDVTPFSFAVTSDVDWSVAEKSDATNHFTVSGVTGNTPPPTGGTGGFTVTPAASDRGDISHTATFTVSGGGQSRDVTVTHDAPARVFSVARTDGDTSSWGFLHGSSVAKSITVTANVGWTATLVNSPGFTLSPSPEGTSTGSFTVSPTGPNDVETPRTATISITGAGAPGDSSTTETITITQAAYSATSDNIIYVVGTGDDAYLSLGSWGNEIDETNYTEKMAFFKWGSVVAFDLVDAHRSFYSNPDIANNAITFNPTTRSFSTYAEIPHTNSIYATSLEAATLNGVRFWGQGDPCQLIGLTVRQIREATDEANFSELLASRAYGYQGWVMPTRQQALYFIYGSDPVIALNPSISNDYVEVHSGNGTIDSPTVLKFKAPTGNGNDAFAGNGTLLPAAGGRQDTGAIASYGNDAVYWTSSSDGGSSGIGLNISSTQARVQSRSRWVGNVVRCIRP